MYFKQILVVKETRQNERRVALTPKAVSMLVNKGFRILVEKDAGLSAGFANDEYLNSGAQIFELTPSGFPANTFIVRVLRPDKDRELLENHYLDENMAMLGFLFPFVADNHISTWQELGITTLSFDLFKSISTDDPKNAQAAMSRIAGRLAFQDALKHYSGEKLLKLTVIGTGPAAISASMEAIKYNVPVQVFGRKEYWRKELEATGIKYYVLPDSGNQTNFIKQYLADETIVITAARTPGKKAPILIDEESLKILPSKAIVIDLAVSNGGNVIGSKSDQIITLSNGVSIKNVSGYPKLEPNTASEEYAKCLFSLITEIMTPEGYMSFDNNLVQEIWVTHEGLRHDSLYDEFDGSIAHYLKLQKIISGGQSGVDRAALDIAIELAIPHGGWCPKGRKAEDGTIDIKYQLQETASEDYSERTKLNVRDSDGTLIIIQYDPIGGTKLTIEYASLIKKPYLIFNSTEQNISAIADWINNNKIKILNIAGPRESQTPGIYYETCKILRQLFKQAKSSN